MSAVAEQIARFRGRTFRPEMLVRRGLPLALVRYVLDDAQTLIDLDDPATLERERLRPSQVATRHRAQTQATARTLFDAHPAAVGLRWWSTLEASWINVTLFAERVYEHLGPHTPTIVTQDVPAFAEACGALGLTA